MDAKKQTFIQLIDQAIALSKGMRQTASSSTERLNTLIHELEEIKANTISGRLQPSEGNITLGLARGVADWIETLDSPLLSAVGEIEKYYQQQL